MARRPESSVTLSVLDRLIDEEPKVRSEAPPTRSQSLRDLKAAIRRDLEWLLNTRQTIEPAPDGAKELPHSMYSYGLRDITSMNLTTTDDRKALGQIIEEIICIFEPRLASPKVTFKPGGEGKSHILRFVIEGMLRIDPAPEYITFDTLLETTNGGYIVKGEASAR